MSSPTAELLRRFTAADIPQLPELVFALARPIGTDTKRVRRTIRAELDRTRFRVESISAAGLLHDLFERTQYPISSERAHERYLRLMSFGDLLRFRRGPHGVAELIVRDIAERRQDAQRAALQSNARGIVYLVSSLMHPDEVALLRSVYRSRFFLLGVFSSSEERLQNLTRELIEGEVPHEDAARIAEQLIDIDRGVQPSTIHISPKVSLSVDRTFHRADVFLATSKSDNGTEALKTIERFIAQVFSNPFGTPTDTELGMAYAYTAARKSGALARQVGAAIVDREGSLISIGWNDPAQAGGGLSSESDRDDDDPSDGYRVDSLHYFLTRLFDEDTWSSTDGEPVDNRVLEWWHAFQAATRSLARLRRTDTHQLVSLPAIAATRLVNLIEFGRCVHAEMAAITDAARRGVPTGGTTMFVTTFPCHECTRNIVAAGITRVVFVEPYGKSLAGRLYQDAVDVHAGPPTRPLGSDVVNFVPFVGVAPRALGVLFSPLDRKYDIGSLAKETTRRPGEKRPWTHSSGVLRNSIRGYTPQHTPRSDRDSLDALFELSHVLAERSVVLRMANLEEQMTVARRT